ncbi:DinB family protein [Neobacillus niacini]|uniref:DinB family protein n=1 Tax=Neobacillus niacini TaxID=86668 RepID=UPI0007AC24D1|nr:DinB family protein [Neobacillus niacini]MEC1520468.1 DinB family protein [Neobacillus niacini]
MYTAISQFIDEWNQEAASTQKVLDALTDQSLQQKISPEDRTLGSIAWHIVASTPGMLMEFGVTVKGVENELSVPTSAREIAETFRSVSAETSEAIRQQWTDENLSETKNVFGRELQKASMLNMLIKHIVHHRGQMTVLMRQAGVQVPGIYGPSREEWSQMGMEAPSI